MRKYHKGPCILDGLYQFYWRLTGLLRLRRNPELSKPPAPCFEDPVWMAALRAEIAESLAKPIPEGALDGLDKDKLR